VNVKKVRNVRVGKSIEAYSEEAGKRQYRSLEVFGETLREFADRHQLGLSLLGRPVAMLFKITNNFLSLRSTVSAIKLDGIERDWREQRKLLKQLKQRLEAAKKRTETAEKKKQFPGASAAGRSIGRDLTRLLRELDYVESYIRLQQSMFQTLRSSARGERNCVLMLNAYVEDELPSLTMAQRDIVIAGALVASGIKCDDGESETISNMPMARSRASQAVDEDGIVAPWLDDSDF